MREIDYKEAVEERSAIMEFLGGMSRQMADAEAKQRVDEEIRRKKHEDRNQQANHDGNASFG